MMSAPLIGEKSRLHTTLEFLRKFDLLVITALFLLLATLISVDRAIDFMIFCIFVLAYDLLYGYMGRLSFGHMLYLGVGAYALALSGEYLSGNPFLGLLIAVGSGAAVGLILGPIIVRTTGACFALINLAFNQLGFFLALVAFSKWTGGEDGMSTSFHKIWIIDFSKKTTVFWFSLLSLILVVFLLRRLTNSLFGILLRGIKENETRVKFLGYDTFARQDGGFYDLDQPVRLCRRPVYFQLQLCNHQLHRPLEECRGHLCQPHRRGGERLWRAGRRGMLQADQQLPAQLRSALGDVFGGNPLTAGVQVQNRGVGISRGLL